MAILKYGTFSDKLLVCVLYSNYKDIVYCQAVLVQLYILSKCKVCIRGWIKSLRSPRLAYSAGPQSTEKCGGCELDALLFM
jgi:hypothetical protein